MLRWRGSIQTPKVDDGLDVPAPTTEPSEALYMMFDSAWEKRSSSLS
jgi:hypothetical protein